MVKRPVESRAGEPAAGEQRRLESAVAVFLKAPAAGRVKTRLARGIGTAHATALYRCFVSDTLRMLAAAGYPLELIYDPPDAGKTLKAWLGDPGRWTPQVPGDLGVRMAAAFVSLFGRGRERVVLMGTDIPHLPAEVLNRAFQALRTHDAVIGPAVDGGYYLIGFRAGTFRHSVFHGVPWSTGEVFSRTMERFGASGLSVHRLPRVRDLDDADDLAALAGDAGFRQQASSSWAYLKASGLATGIF